MIFKSYNEKGLEYYVDKDFAGDWDKVNSGNSEVDFGISGYMRPHLLGLNTNFVSRIHRGYGKEECAQMYRSWD